MRAVLFLALLAPPLAATAVSESVKLDRAPIDPRDALSVQRGAQVFVNYCQSCHSAQYMRYNRLFDLGLTEQQVKDNLVFVGDKVGATMGSALRAADAKNWFGAPPPDLSVIARSRGADWLYSYLRTYYRDERSPTGWNNLVFPNVAMPHVLWELQGQQVLKVAQERRAHGEDEVRALELTKPGTLPPREYDRLVGDLVNYLVFMGEPARLKRTQIGVGVVLALGVLFVLVYLLKKDYWKDVH